MNVNNIRCNTLNQVAHRYNGQERNTHPFVGGPLKGREAVDTDAILFETTYITIAITGCDYPHVMATIGGIDGQPMTYGRYSSYHRWVLIGHNHNTHKLPLSRLNIANSSFPVLCFCRTSSTGGCTGRSRCCSGGRSSSGRFFGQFGT